MPQKMLANFKTYYVVRNYYLFSLGVFECKTKVRYGSSIYFKMFYIFVVFQ